MTMIILHLPLAVFSFSEKLSRIALASKGQNNFALSSDMHSFFQQNINANLTFAVNLALNLSNAKLTEM